ncbi:GNAT family N-acetyltransferase [Streptomyces violaceus]|uniref:Acetyltransferase n=1 Tax=Streptomyces violaceus TaxID=1936 RepID=A0ABZ1P6Q7_STRVL
MDGRLDGVARLGRPGPVAGAPLVQGELQAEGAGLRVRVDQGVGSLVGLARERQVAETYAHLDTLATHHAFLVVRDGEPVALLQTYEPASDRVSDCYDVRPGDIGVHLLLAPAGPDGTRSGWTARLVSSIAGYVLLGLDRRRVVVDPDVRNEKAVTRFLELGFTAGPVVVLPEIDLPDVHLPQKKAQLAFLDREVLFPG